MYRPQFAYPCPRGYEDGDFDHYFDYRNTVLLNNTSLAAGLTVLNIQLNLQTDHPFFIRGIQVKAVNAGDPVISAQFKDAHGNYLSDDFVPLDLSVAPDGQAQFFTNVVFEPALPCLAGSVVWMNLKNQTSSTQDLTKVRVTISGVKRYVLRERRCA
jgi:hypothetical protein